MRTGTIVLAVFGLGWWLAGASTLAWPGMPVTAAVGSAVACGLVVSAFRHRPAAGGGPLGDTAVRRTFNRVNAAQWIAIVAVVAAANALGAVACIPGLIAVIIGLHFLPLARLFEQPAFRVTAALLVAAGLAGVFVGAAGGSPAAARIVVAFPAALILWGTASAGRLLHRLGGKARGRAGA